ncbi:helix-turn-helix domain-containing protein [Serratia ficaria]|uniref:helix-turn-helix domain-containing protein n=2 Tax=Serratia ficaria TaxID=61651 RepID=UPI0036F3EB13
MLDIHLTFGGAVFMKYSLPCKLGAVRHSLAGFDNQSQTAKKFAVALVQLRRWIAVYQHHGETRLQSGRQRHYMPEFKLAAVEFARANPPLFSRRRRQIRYPPIHDAGTVSAAG